MENAFKFVFGLTVIVFCLVIIGIFLLALKISLIWLSSITLFGIHMTAA